MCVIFFSSFSFLLDRVLSRVCVKSGGCTLLTTTHLKSHQRSYISAKITTQEFFFFTEAKKAHNSSTKNEERATETEALSKTKQSQRSAHTMRRSCPFFFSRRTGNNRIQWDAKALATTQQTPHTLKESFLYKNRCTQRCRPAM